MKVYTLSIVLLTYTNFSYGKYFRKSVKRSNTNLKLSFIWVIMAQQEHIFDTVHEAKVTISLGNQSHILEEKPDNSINYTSKPWQESTENDSEHSGESNRQIISTRNSKEEKLKKNTIRVFDMETKQYIRVDLANLTQPLADNTQVETFHEELYSEIQNVDKDNEIKNKANYIISDSKDQLDGIGNYTYIQIVDKTYDFQNNTVSTVNGSRISTINDSNDSKTELNYIGNNFESLETNVADNSENKTVYAANSLQNQVVCTDDSEIKTFEIEKNNIRNHSSIKRLSGKRINCKQIIVNFCVRIETIRRYDCDDGTTIPLSKVCDGYTDCHNSTDEENCVEQVVEKIELANKILEDAEILNECLHQIVEGNSFLELINIWKMMLETELKYNNDTNIGSCEMISSIFDIFEVHLCRPVGLYNVFRDDWLKMEAEFESLMDDGEKLNNFSWSPTSCTCNHQFCKSDYCDSRCSRICWQVYVLDHFGCTSVTGATSIPLDYICDGKIDCVNEIDESSCMKESSTYKHKANIIYDKVLTMLAPKVVSQQFEGNKIKTLTKLVSQLQILTTRTPNPDINTIKSLRDKFFKLLVKIFKKLWATESAISDLNKAHDFLLLLNQNMIEALKRSYTGNKYVVSLSDCYCNDGVCASVVCSKKCIEFCLGETALTKYRCNDNNTFVSIHSICDGNNDCLNGEDEKYCKHEVCRARQLDKLRINLEKADKLLSGIVFNKVLEVWQEKISQIIISTDNKEPSRKTLENKVSRILDELLSAYSSMVQTTRTSNLDIHPFITVSDIIKKTLQSCNK